MPSGSVAERDPVDVFAAYFAAFAEPDRGRRLELLARCLDAEGEILGPQQVFRGHEAVSAKIDALRGRRPGERLVAQGEPEAFGETMARAAALVSPDGTTRAEGEALFEFAADGRIRRVLPCWLDGVAREAPWPGDEFFRELERRRTQALVARDAATCEALHSPAYRLVSPSGRVFTCEDYLGAIAKEPFYSSWTMGEVAVRRGRGVAWVRYAARLGFPSGNVIDVVHSDAYEARDGGWSAIASFAIRIPREGITLPG